MYSFECPTSFSHLWPTRPVQLLYTDTHSHLLAQPQSSILPWFTWAIVTFRIIGTFVFYSWNVVQKRVEMFTLNAYLWEQQPAAVDNLNDQDGQ